MIRRIRRSQFALPLALCFMIASLIFSINYTQAGTTAYDMVISAGIPQIGNGDYTTTGNVFFVDSGHAARRDAANAGTYDKPFATLDYAIGRCTASNGDIIFVAPGHAENISSAAMITADVAGVRIVGLGIGANRPTFTWTNANASIIITAANVSFENIVFDMSCTGGAYTGVSVSAADVRFIGNTVIVADLTGHIGDAIYIDSDATRFLASDNLITGLDYAASGVSSIFKPAAGATSLRLIRNDIAARTGNTPYALIDVRSKVTDFVVADSNLYNFNSGASAMAITDSVQGYIKDTLVSYVNPNNTTGVTDYEARAAANYKHTSS